MKTYEFERKLVLIVFFYLAPHQWTFPWATEIVSGGYTERWNYRAIAAVPGIRWQRWNTFQVVQGHRISVAMDPTFSQIFWIQQKSSSTESMSSFQYFILNGIIRFSFCLIYLLEWTIQYVICVFSLNLKTCVYLAYEVLNCYVGVQKSVEWKPLYFELGNKLFVFIWTS